MISKEIKKYKEKHPAYQVTKLKLMMNRAFSRFLKQGVVNLTPEQAQVMGLILENEKVYMNAISNELGIDNSAVTRLVDNLVQKGFIKRVHSTQDRRVRLVQLTEDGEKEICKTFEISEQYLKLLLQDITNDELDTFLRTIKKMYQNIENDLIKNGE